MLRFGVLKNCKGWVVVSGAQDGRGDQAFCGLIACLPDATPWLHVLAAGKLHAGTLHFSIQQVSLGFLSRKATCHALGPLDRRWPIHLQHQMVNEIRANQGMFG
jgi:hypothetical protein